MQLREIMTKNVSAVDRNASIQEAARIMKEQNVGVVPVCESDKIVGMVTDRDIVIRSVVEGKQPSSVTCEQIMSTAPVVGNPNMDVHEAAKIMADHQIRRLPVVENGRLMGIVALGDLAVENNFVDEAGDALNDISKPSRPNMQ